MLRYIIGGVVLGAIGYGLKKYFDNSDIVYHNGSKTSNEYKSHEYNENRYE